jgi:hypothetical protein
LRARDCHTVAQSGILAPASESPTAYAQSVRLRDYFAEQRLDMLTTLFLAFAFSVWRGSGSALHPAPPSALTLTTHQVQQDARPMLVSARSLRCTFDSGTAVVLSNSGPSVRPDALLGPVTFDAIDRTGQRARLVGALGAADVSLVAGATWLTFIDTSTPAPGLYTVYAAFAPSHLKKALVAVGSIHEVAPVPTGELVYGSCTVLQ